MFLFCFDVILVKCAIVNCGILFICFLAAGYTSVDGIFLFIFISFSIVLQILLYYVWYVLS